MWISHHGETWASTRDLPHPVLLEGLQKVTATSDSIRNCRKNGITHEAVQKIQIIDLSIHAEISELLCKARGV